MADCYYYDYSTFQNYTIACNDVVGSPNSVTGYVQYDTYWYTVNTASTYVFVALFSALTVAHFALAVYWRKWSTLFTLTLGAALEAVGWGGRLWSALVRAWDPNQGGYWRYTNHGFLMQIVCLIVAPTFFSAANYILLGTLVRVTGERYSSWRSRSLAVLFTFADFVCLIVQGTGGGRTGAANTDAGRRHGLHIMAIGVIIQMILTVVFLGFYGEFVHRWRKDLPAKRQFDPFGRLVSCTRRPKSKSNSPSESTAPTPTPMEMVGKDALPAEMGEDPPDQRPEVPHRRVWASLGATLSSSLLIIIRSIYRCDELLSYTGNQGGAYNNQALFIGMDAVLMLLLLVVYVVIHPGLLDGRALL